MKDFDPGEQADKIFESLNKTSLKLLAREGSTVEFKESFNWNSKDKYAKSMAAFANAKGGFLIFGIKDKPRMLVGMANDNFSNMDEAIITAYLNNIFSPEIHYRKFVLEAASKKAGIIYTYPSEAKPVIAIKNDGDSVKEAEIYYRYTARSEKIKFPELKSIFDTVKETERANTFKMFERIVKAGSNNIGILDVNAGVIEGSKHSLVIDKKLIPKLKFIKEGQFVEKGKPTLKLIGDVQPIAGKDKKTIIGNVRFDSDNPNAIPVSEETILLEYPLSYGELTSKLSKRYTDFIQNQAYHNLRKELIKNNKYCYTRYLDPKRKKGRKDFYSERIIKEFDKRYTLAPKP